MNFAKDTAQPGRPGSAGCKLPFFQAKLTINHPNDVYEQEADSMADKVMRMTDTQGQGAFFKPVQNMVQRKCEHCEEEEKMLHRKEGADGEAQAAGELDSYVGSLNSSGRALPEESRSFFEPRFGHDFSNVRVHTDSVAAKSAQSINALAYTAGNNIVFNNGQYSPDSDSGKKLMAHELTHVVQQGNGVQTKIQRECDAAKKSNSKQADVQLFVVSNDDGTSATAGPNMAEVSKVWKRCCINLNVLGTKTIKSTASKILEVGGGTASDKETTLAGNKTAKAINVFTVKTFKKDGVEDKNLSGGGRTFYLGSSAPVSLLVEGAVPTVVAHEIGHALRGNVDHVAGTIMEGSGAYDAPNPDKVTAAVCTSAKTWSEIKDVPAPNDCCMDF